jgi:hypothetical protein
VALRLVPRVPVIVADVEDDTACVLTVNVRLVEPAATVTLAGTVAAAVLLLDSVTTTPPDGAADDNVTVPCEVPPPETLDGDKDKDANVGVLALPGVTVSPAAHVVFKSAHTFANVVVVTLVVPTVNVALVAPAGMITLAGPVAGLHGDICTDAPPVGAGALIVTVAVDVPPATTVVGFNVSDVTQRLFGADGLIVNAALADDGP